MSYKYAMYGAFIILLIIPLFDKESKLLWLQFVCIGLIAIMGYLGWRQDRNKT